METHFAGAFRRTGLVLLQRECGQAGREQPPDAEENCGGDDETGTGEHGQFGGD